MKSLLIPSAASRQPRFRRPRTPRGVLLACVGAGLLTVAASAQTPADGTAVLPATTAQTPPDAAQAAPAGAQTLPAAPSAVLAAQDGPLLRAAGSGLQFHPSGTTLGPGAVPIEQPIPGRLPLSLDDAISLALERNVRLQYDRATEREVRGYSRDVIAAVVPNLRADAYISAQEINLAAMGFKPSSLAAFGITDFSSIVKVNVAQATVNATQQLFNMPDYEIFRGIKHQIASVDLNTGNDRQDVILATGRAYLLVLADAANVANTVGEVRSAQLSFDQASARHTAGVGTNLDALRAQVELQQRQQDQVASQNTLDKDTIALSRVIGLPAGQALQLTDTTPFSELGSIDLHSARNLGYAHRQDLLGLDEQIVLIARVSKAAKYQRFPTVALNGDYGVLGQVGGLYHGVFTATGTLSVPVFREAAQRGEEQVIDAQLTSLQQHEGDLRADIDAEIRTAILDVETASKLVAVARSNAELSGEELSDARDRFAAGVSDNLPVVDAETTVTSAQAQLVQALFQFNLAKLQLARSTGLIELRYRAFLGRS